MRVQTAASFSDRHGRTARRARAVWCQTPSDEAREAVESAGLAYVAEPQIADAVRALRG